jgi:hypothetical protein
LKSHCVHSASPVIVATPTLNSRHYSVPWVA